MLRLRWKTLLSCCLGVAALAGMLAFALNQSDDEKGMRSEVAFSQPSGFYDDAFMLEMTGDGNPIYYTLDCTDPDADSNAHTDPDTDPDADADPDARAHADTDTNPEACCDAAANNYGRGCGKGQTRDKRGSGRSAGLCHCR